MQNPSNDKILSTSALIGTTLIGLLGGMAVVVRALRNVNLHLDLDLKKDDATEKKY